MIAVFKDYCFSGKYIYKFGIIVYCILREFCVKYWGNIEENWICVKVDIWVKFLKLSGKFLDRKEGIGYFK